MQPDVKQAGQSSGFCTPAEQQPIVIILILTAGSASKSTAQQGVSSGHRFIAAEKELTGKSGLPSWQIIANVLSLAPFQLSWRRRRQCCKNRVISTVPAGPRFLD